MKVKHWRCSSSFLINLHQKDIYLEDPLNYKAITHYYDLWGFHVVISFHLAGSVIVHVAIYLLNCYKINTGLDGLVNIQIDR